MAEHDEFWTEKRRVIRKGLLKKGTVTEILGDAEWQIVVSMVEGDATDKARDAILERGEPLTKEAIAAERSKILAKKINS